MLPPVTGTDHSFQITPHSTCSAVWVRIRAWRRSQSISPCTGVPTGGTSPSTLVPGALAVLAHVHDASRAAVPGEGARVVGLPAAGGVEGRAIEVDAAVADGQDDGLERAQLGVSEEQEVGGHGRPVCLLAEATFTASKHKHV